MSLYTVVTGNVINANDWQQVINVLQAPSGNQEKGQYFMAGWGATGGDLVSVWVPTLSRNATPVSVSIDTSINSPTNLNSFLTGNLSSSGFQVYCTTSAATLNGFGGGAYSVQY